MKKMKVIDLFGIDYSKMNDKINDALILLQKDGKNIVEFKVLGDHLNKCAVFILYED